MLQVTEDSRHLLEVEGLIDRWQRHRDERAFNRLLAMHRNIIVEEARWYRWSGTDYADAVAAGHEGFLAAVNKAKVGRGEARFATYCRPFIRNVIIDYRRLRDVGDPTKARHEADGEAPLSVEDLANYIADPTPSPERVAIARCDARALLGAMKILSPKQRRVVEALHFEDLTANEVAEEMGLTAPYVRLLAQQACGILRYAITT